MERVVVCINDFKNGTSLMWKKIYRLIVKYYQKKQGIGWKLQGIDSKMLSAPLGGDLTGTLTPPIELNLIPNDLFGLINVERRCQSELQQPVRMVFPKSGKI